MISEGTVVGRSAQFRYGWPLPADVLLAVPLLFIILHWLPAASSSPLLAQATESGSYPTIARIHYEGGGDWYANPSSLPNLLVEIGRRSTVRVASQPAEVRLTDPDLADHPYLYMTGHGNFSLSDREVEALQGYLRSGGFLHADDNYGLDASFRREVQRLFPDEALRDVPLDHPIYRMRYPFPEGLPKIHEHDGLPAQGLGIFVEGRLVLFYSFQSDLGDGWEDPAVHGDPPDLREQAIRMGVNLFLYALSAAPPR